MAACGLAGAVSLPSSFKISQSSSLKKRYRESSVASKDDVLYGKITMLIVIYIVALFANLVRPCFNALDRCTGNESSNKHFDSSLFCGYKPTHIWLPGGQFALYRNVLNNGKVAIQNTTSNKIISHKAPQLLRKLSGYLLLTLLLAGDVHLNPGPVERDVGPNHRAALTEINRQYPGLENRTMSGYEFTILNSNLHTTESATLG